MIVKTNKAALRAILRINAEPTLKAIADRVANSTENLTGPVDGRHPTVTRYDERGPARARSVVVVHHPSADGRAAAQRAAEASLRIAGT
jgi:hypothetical protein